MRTAALAALGTQRVTAALGTQPVAVQGVPGRQLTDSAAASLWAGIGSGRGACSRSFSGLCCKMRTTGLWGERAGLVWFAL